MEIKFTESFIGSNYATDDFTFLSSGTTMVHLRWNPSVHRFTPCAGNSARSTDWFKKLSQTDFSFLDEKTLVNMNFSRFVALARNGNLQQRQWLRDFLLKYEDSPEKRMLLKASGSS